MAKSNKKIGNNRNMNPNSLKNLTPGGPGRPPGSKNHDGLGTVLQMLKDMVSEKQNIETLRIHMQTMFDKNPTGFFVKILMPLFPKTVSVDATDAMTQYMTTMASVFHEAEQSKAGKK